ncbi:MAG: hypothetical protein FWC70_05365 [Defluviitaleaceae bacterium]|nr:hypothetical protein [Defluviitaleaceae bacterium]
MKRYNAAAIIIIIHGLIEIAGFFSVLPIWLGAEQNEFVPFDPPSPEIIIGGVIWGILRIIAGVGLFKNRKWGFALSVIFCAVTIAKMFEVLPFGLMDAVLAGSALILMLTAYYGKRKIEDAA